LPWTSRRNAPLFLSFFFCSFCLGKGCTGVVQLGVHEKTGFQCAIKILRKDQLQVVIFIDLLFFSMSNSVKQISLFRFVRAAETHFVAKSETRNRHSQAHRPSQRLEIIRRS
jgi:hypothetical protein